MYGKDFFRYVASGLRSSRKNPNAWVVNVQRDAVVLLSSDAYSEPHAR